MKKILGALLLIVLVEGCKKEIKQEEDEPSYPYLNASSLRNTAPSIIQWKSCFGTTGDDVGNVVAPAADGGYFIAGSVNSRQTGYLTKVNSDNTASWTQAVLIDGNGIDEVMAVVATSDGGCLVAGGTSSTDITGYGGSSDVLLAKISATGEVEWKQAIGTAAAEKANAIIKTTDGGFALTGYSDHDLLIIKLNSTAEISPGNILLWEKRLSLPDFKGNSGESIIEQSGYYFVAGRTLTVDDVTRRILFAKVAADNSSAPDIIKAIPGETGEMAFGIVKNIKGSGFVLAGRNAMDAMVLSVDENGNPNGWKKTYGGSGGELFHSIVATNTGYLLAGETGSKNGDIVSSKGGVDVWLVTITGDGNKTGSYNLGGQKNDEGNHVIKTGDNKYLIIGSTNSTSGDVSGNKGGFDIWAVKVQLP